MVSEYTWLRDLSKVICFVPVYVDGEAGGDFTEVWMEDGTKHLVRKKINTVLKNVALFLGIDIRQQAAAWAGTARKHTCPLSLGPSITLVPVPVRRPRTRNESGTGYIVVQKFSFCARTSPEEAAQGYPSAVVFKGGQRLLSIIKFERLAARIIEGQNASKRSEEVYASLIKESSPETAQGTYMTIKVNKDTGEIFVY